MEEAVVNVQSERSNEQVHSPAESVPAQVFLLLLSFLVCVVHFIAI